MPFGSAHAYPHKPFRWSGGAGYSGQSGFSGASGGGGSGGSGISGMSGWSGFSGEGASAYEFTTRAYVTLDEVRLADLHVVVPPDALPSAELGLALEGGKTYLIRGTIFNQGYKLPKDPSAQDDINWITTQWNYTGTVANFSLSFLDQGQKLIPPYGGAWVAVNQKYPEAIGSWSFYFIGHDFDPNYVTTSSLQLDGTIETTTGGILQFAWYPYQYTSDPTVFEAAIKRGSYIEAIDVGGGAASGCSGFSGKDAIIRVGTFTGI